MNETELIKDEIKMLFQANELALLEELNNKNPDKEYRQEIIEKGIELEKEKLDYDEKNKILENKAYKRQHDEIMDRIKTDFQQVDLLTQEKMYKEAREYNKKYNEWKKTTRTMEELDTELVISKKMRERIETFMENVDDEITGNTLDITGDSFITRKKQKDELQEKNDKLEADKSSLQNKNSELEEDKSTLKAEKSTLKAEKSSLQETIEKDNVETLKIIYPNTPNNSPFVDLNIGFIEYTQANGDIMYINPSDSSVNGNPVTLKKVGDNYYYVNPGNINQYVDPLSKIIVPDGNKRKSTVFYTPGKQYFEKHENLYPKDNEITYKDDKYVYLVDIKNGYFYDKSENKYIDPKGGYYIAPENKKYIDPKTNVYTVNPVYPSTS